MVPETEDILRRTLQGLEGDFEELRNELIDDLANHDDELRFCVRSLPEWLELPFSRIRHLLLFSDESIAPGALLGPHAVALAAGELQDFSSSWLGEDNKLHAHDFTNDPELLASYREELAHLQSYFETLEAEASAVALAARASLNLLHDEIIAELEEEREQDTEALQQLVSMGDLDGEFDRREEIAQLWEDQRQRAGEFSQRWSKLDEQVDIALERTRAGIDELRFLLENLRQGMSGGYPLLDDNYREEGAGKPSMSLVLEEEDAGETAPPATKKSASSSEEFMILAPERADHEEEEGDDFDPYGDLPKEEEIDPEEARAELRRKFLEETRKKAREKEAFLQDPSEENDDIIYTSQEGEGPMVDFFEDEDDRAADFFESTSPLPSRPRTPTPATRQPVARAARSPYDVFLSEESRPEASEPLDSAHDFAPILTRRPEASTAPAAAPEIEDASVETAPISTAPSITQPSMMLVLDDEEEEGNLDDVVSTPTEDVIIDDASTPTRPSVEGETLPPSTPPAEDTLDTEDVGPTSPVIQDARAMTQEVDEDAIELAVERPPTHPSIPEALAEDLPEAPPSPPPSTPPAPAPQEEDEAIASAREEEAPVISSPPRRRASGVGVRVREGYHAISYGELGVAYGLPLLVMLGILFGAATANAPESNPLLVGSVTQLLAMALLAWLALGPWVMRWKITWRGFEPIVIRNGRLRDEAEIELDGALLEIGPWEVDTRTTRETSSARWEEGGQRGWLLTAIDADGEIWSWIAAQGDGEDHVWESSSLPLTRAPRGAWRVDGELFGQLEEALLEGVSVPLARGRLPR